MCDVPKMPAALWTREMIQYFTYQLQTHEKYTQNDTTSMIETQEYMTHKWMK